MDKYEFNIKVEQIKKMAGRSDYETAMKIADTIDWRRVRNVNILSMVATIYEKNAEYQEAKDILLLAFERAPIGKRLLFKLAELAIKEGSFQEAEDYYREFCDLAPDDPRQYILRYLILGAKGAPVEQLIHTLEQYCNIELDEKWLYELAELYGEADMGDLCIMACDKIMLMFGLGKYVEKAMELKIQFAPLTKYQMDLVENRDKYEAKLKAVEQKFRMGAPVPDYGDDPEMDRDMSASTYMARQESAFAREPEEEYPEDGYPEEEYAEGGYPGDRYPEEGYPKKRYPEEGYSEKRYPEESYPEESYPEEGRSEKRYQEEYPEEAYSEDGYPEEYGEETSPEEGYSRTRYPKEGYSDEYEEEDYQGTYEEEDSDEYEEPHSQVTIESEESDIEEEEQEETQSQWMPQEQTEVMSEEAVRARIHEAEVQANLAMEMSRISDAVHRPELASAQTRVLTDIRDLTKENSGYEAHHLMIEADDFASGLELAVETLKMIHKETGAKNQAAKITGEKLNSKGLFSIADKLTGKDLIIEQAGAMEEKILQELNQLMARDETGMNVVLIDNASELALIYQVYPGLAKRFEYVGSSVPAEAAYTAPQADDRPVRQVQVRSAEEIQSKKVLRQPEEQPVKRENAAVETPLPKKVRRAEEEPQPKQSPKRIEEPSRMSVPARKEEGVKERHAEPVKNVPAKKEVRQEVPEKVAEQPLPQLEEPEYEDETEMDIDEFAKYACEYAGDIDCSISGKSMLALYERIEIMEEDGIPLTKVNAEDLIEEAADKAENPSFFKRLTGIFSSKYDRDGLLILKEEHFI